jgi:hypothetical protein
MSPFSVFQCLDRSIISMWIFGNFFNLICMYMCSNLKKETNAVCLYFVALNCIVDRRTVQSGWAVHGGESSFAPRNHMQDASIEFQNV